MARARLRARSSVPNQCLMRERALPDLTKCSQSRLGLREESVMIYMVSPFLRGVLSGTMRPLTLAPAQWFPTSV